MLRPLDQLPQLPYIHDWMQQEKSNKRKLQGARTRDDLLAAAIKVFAERGYHGATMEDIVASAGTTRGALYWHFSNKEDFLVSLLTKSQELWNRERADELEVTGEAGEIPDVLIWWAEFSDRIPWFARLFLTIGLDADNISPRISDAIRQQLATTRRFLASAIKHGQRRGVLRADLDPDEAGALLLVVRLGLLASWFSDPASFDLGQLTQSFIRVLLPALFTSARVATKGLLRRRKTAEYDALTRLWLEQRGLSTLGFRRNARRPQATKPKRTSPEKPSFRPVPQ
jgi:TetR/AcrR family acrAB operon transcriptional repressor